MKRVLCVALSALFVFTGCGGINSTTSNDESIDAATTLFSQETTTTMADELIDDVDLSLDRIKVFYDCAYREQAEIRYFFVYLSVEDICLVTEELLKALRLDKWKEVNVDPQSEAYREQVLYSHTLESTNEYSVVVYIGREYGAIEVHVPVYDELDNGVKTQGSASARGVYFQLPQDEPQEIAHKIHEMATEYYAQQKG